VFVTGGRQNGVSFDRLEREIVELAAHLEVDMERWLMLIAEFDRRGGAGSWGFKSTAEWLAWACGICHRTARDHVRVARGLVQMPEVHAAFAAREVSYSKVRALTRATEAAPATRRSLLEMARSSTADEVERAVSSLRTAPSAGLETANAAHDRRYFTWWFEEDGSLRISGRLPADAGALLVEVVESAAEALHPPAAEVAPAEADRDGAAPDAESTDGDAEVHDHQHDHEPAPRPMRPGRNARRADALTEILASGAPRAQVTLHVDLDALACTADAPEERRGEICALRNGPAIPSETARRLACDADLQVAAAGASGETGYGRRRRVVSPPLRRSLELRDGGCRFPGCRQTHGLHAHHIEHWAHGGRTDRSNLVLLCPFHHRLVHEGGFTVAADDRSESPDALPHLVFRRPDGRLVPHAPRVRRPLDAQRGPPVLEPA
jgi:hypothetical protein